MPAEETGICSYDYDAEVHQIKIVCPEFYGSSIEDFEMCMAIAIDALTENKAAQSIVFMAARNVEYDYEQTRTLSEIARLLVRFLKEERILQLKNLAPLPDDPNIASRLAFLERLLSAQLRMDPVGAYVSLVREIRHLRARARTADPLERASVAHYLTYALYPVKVAFDKTRMINRVRPRLAGYKIGDRSIYRELFHPIVRPNFMLTKYMMLAPAGGQEIDRYKIGPNGETEVQVYRVPGKLLAHYHVVPPEFLLAEEEYTILDAARQYLAEHKPTRSEFAQPDRMREVFFNIGRDLLAEISERLNVTLDSKRLDLLAGILTRYTAGYGILEVVLWDANVQDVFLNAPVGQVPVFIFHGTHEECVTNIIPTRDDAASWATRFRIESGRPLDEANPVLDTEIDTPGGRARVAAITRTLSPDGLGFALRRHRERPWTYPLFINERMLNPLAAGLLSFIIDGARTMLFAGTRGTGKTSLLGSTISEITKRYRIVTVEDTLELPVEQLKRLGYNIARLKSRSIITHVETELPMEEAIRVSLRLGDSCLFIGEVRSVEAKALYESMRIGALANVVAGTIHADSPYGIYDRVVNDLGVPPTSFKATDIMVIANRLRTPDGLHSFRRMTEITEQLKDWRRDPQEEKAFVPLMTYDSKRDELVPTDVLKNGESFVLNEIARRVKDWKDNWGAVWDNILLRAKIKEYTINYARQTGKPNILEAPFVTEANAQFHLISERVREELGSLVSKVIFERWDAWAKDAVKRVI